MQLAENRHRWAAPLILVAVLAAQIITHLAWLPISTQVGQLAQPWLMSRGMVLFDTVIENRPPATGVLLAALYRALPQVEPVLLVRALNLIVILALTLLVYVLAKRLTGSERAAIFSVLFWVLWEPVYGNQLFYFDTLVGLLLTLVAIIALDARRARSFVLCGLLLGLATLFKQPAWAAVAMVGLWLIAQRRWRDLLALAGGVLVFPVLAVITAALQGLLESYLFWNYGRYFSGSLGNQPLTGNIIRKFLFTNILAPSFILLAFKQQPHQRWRWLLIAAVWLGGMVNMLPNFSETYFMAHLPMLAVMSGIVIAVALPEHWRGWRERADTAQVTLAGIALVIVISWVWIVITPYAPIALGRASIPAYDEFKQVAARLNALKQPEDTLYVLPMLDGNAQLLQMTNMMPPGSLILSHSVFTAVPGMVERLLGEWETEPPDMVVIFPDLEPYLRQWIDPLLTFVEANYTAIERVDDVMFNGNAIIYRINERR